jgi:hypothetical protein
VWGFVFRDHAITFHPSPTISSVHRLHSILNVLHQHLGSRALVYTKSPNNIHLRPIHVRKRRIPQIPDNLSALSAQLPNFLLAASVLLLLMYFPICQIYTAGRLIRSSTKPPQTLPFLSPSITPKVICITAPPNYPQTATSTILSCTFQFRSSSQLTSP